MGRRAYVSIDAHANLTARWEEKHKHVYVTDLAAGVSILLDPADAERLAAELVIATDDAATSARAGGDDVSAGDSRTDDALIHDHYSHDEWVAALQPLRASDALEVETQSYGVYIANESGGVRLHVPRLGTALGVDEPHQQNG